MPAGSRTAFVLTIRDRGPTGERDLSSRSPVVPRSLMVRTKAVRDPAGIGQGPVRRPGRRIPPARAGPRIPFGRTTGGWVGTNPLIGAPWGGAPNGTLT